MWVTNLTLTSLFSILIAVFPALAAPADNGLPAGYPLHLKNNQIQTFSGEIYTFVNHASEYWEPQKMTHPGVKNLLEFSKNNLVPSFGMVSRFGGNNPQFFNTDEVLYIAQSDAGQVRYKFPNAKIFLISGGNMGLCLCELLRDLILGSSSVHNKKIQMFLVTDAIYDPKISWPPFQNPSQAPGNQYLLEELVQRSLQDRTLLTEYFKYFIIGFQQPFCPSQNYYDSPNINKKNFHFSVFDGTEFLADFGDPHKSLHIQFILVKSSQLLQMLKEWQIDSLLPINRPELIAR